MIENYSEISELLDEIENLLVKFEGSFKGGKYSLDIVHYIFRKLHNLKSALAMSKKEETSAFVHSLEEIFDFIRNKKLEPTPGLIDVSLRLIDAVKTDTASGDNLAELQTYGRELEDFLHEHGVSPELHADTIAKESELDLQKLCLEAKKQDLFFYQIDKSINSNIAEDVFNSLPVINTVKEVGTLVAIVPDFENLSKDLPECVISIFFQSKQSIQDLYMEIFDPFEEITCRETTPKKDLPSQRRRTEKRKSVPELRTLVVEDNLLITKLHMGMMKEYGKVEIAINGNEASFIFANALEVGNPFDLILLDLNLPGVSGFHVLEEIRRCEQKHNIHGLQRVKVIIISQLSDINNIQHSFRKQADAYIVKPLSKKKLDAELKRLFIENQDV